MTPEIRFKGYTQDWEQRKLETLVSRVKSYSLSRDVETLEHSEYRYVHYGDIHTKLADVIDESSLLPSIKPGNYELLDKYDLILADASEDYQGIATPAVVTISPSYKLVAGLHTIALRPISVDSIYLYYIFNSRNFRKHGYRVGTGMKVFGISVSNVLNFEGRFPSIDEQHRVGKFLKKIDETIALHQEKLEKLIQLKKGYLHALFPQKEEKVPRLRFANFSTDWEQRKLKDISEKSIEKNKNALYTETFTNSAEFGIVSQNDYFDKKISNQNNINGYYIVHPDDFVYNPRISNFAPVGPIKRNNLGRTGVMSPLYYVFKTMDIYNLYLEKYFATTHWHNFMKLNGDSGARADRFAIKDSVLKEMPIPYPSNDEQIKIGNFLKKLDNTILLQKKKVLSLQEIKKVYLKKIFA